MKRVTFNDDIDYCTTMAYSTIYGTVPKLVVATATGTMEVVSTLADHYTGKSAEVMRAYQSACAHLVVQARRNRRCILRAFLVRASQRAGTAGNKRALPQAKDSSC